MLTQKILSLYLKEFIFKILKYKNKKEVLKNWAGKFNINATSGVDIFYKFVFSEENQKIISNYSDEEFITFLHKSILDRIPDIEELNTWLEKINTGMTREEVVKLFGMTNEFIILCQYFNINILQK